MRGWCVTSKLGRVDLADINRPWSEDIAPSTRCFWVKTQKLLSSSIRSVASSLCVLTTRRYTNPRLPLPYLYLPCSSPSARESQLSGARDISPEIVRLLTAQIQTRFTRNSRRNAAAGLPNGSSYTSMKWNSGWLMSGMVSSKASLMTQLMSGANVSCVYSCKRKTFWAFILTPGNAYTITSVCNEHYTNVIVLNTSEFCYFLCFVLCK